MFENDESEPRHACLYQKLIAQAGSREAARKMLVDLLRDAVEMGNEACVSERMSSWDELDSSTRALTLYRLRKKCGQQFGRRPEDRRRREPVPDYAGLADELVAQEGDTLAAYELAADELACAVIRGDDRGVVLCNGICKELGRRYEEEEIDEVVPPTPIDDTHIGLNL
jgi:hypothetical protein